MSLQNSNRILRIQLVVMFLLLVWSLCRSHGGAVQVLDTANTVRFTWAGTNAQVSADTKTWENYDATVYSMPVLLCGSNVTSGFLRGSNVVAKIEVLTNQVQGLTFIGTEYLRAFAATNQPPLPP